MVCERRGLRSQPRGAAPRPEARQRDARPYGETLVVDWGLAKPVDRPAQATAAAESRLLPPAAHDSDVTRIGRAIGTPAYMSPEQAAGAVDLIGRASDIYSLGATLYSLLTGLPPVQGRDVDAIQKRVLRGEFALPRAVQSWVPRPLEAICLKAMALEPADRYRSARALAEDVGRWLADAPVQAHRENAAERLARSDAPAPHLEPGGRRGAAGCHASRGNRGRNGTQGGLASPAGP